MAQFELKDIVEIKFSDYSENCHLIWFYNAELKYITYSVDI